MDAELQSALRDDLKQVLTRYQLSEHEANILVDHVWADVEDAFDFAEFLDQMRQGTQAGAQLTDPVADLSDSAREALLQRHLAALTPKIREGLSHSRGKWAKDEGRC